MSPHANLAPSATAKYGVPCTHTSWQGWPLRVGHFARKGVLHELVAETDAVLVWSGGASDVNLVERRSRTTQRHQFTRHGGEVDFLPRGTTLEEVSWNGQASSCTSIHFDAARVQELLGRKVSFESERIRLCATDAHVVDLVRRLQSQAVAGQPLGALYVEGLSLALASYVYARYAGAVQSEIKGTPALPMDPLIDFVEAHLGRNIGLLDLAGVAGYSPDHFARLFKQAFGLTPYQYVLERRVERAKSLLRGHTHSIAEVAMLCGFANQAHFNTAFKSRTGVTPGVYRKG